MLCCSSEQMWCRYLLPVLGVLFPKISPKVGISIYQALSTQHLPCTCNHVEDLDNQPSLCRRYALSVVSSQVHLLNGFYTVIEMNFFLQFHIVVLFIQSSKFWILNIRFWELADVLEQSSDGLSGNWARHWNSGHGF